jgi:hypothetical protein
MPRKRPPGHPANLEKGLPPWARTVAWQLDMQIARRRHGKRALSALTATVVSLRARTTNPARRKRVLDRFLRACLDLLAEVAATRPDLAGIRKDLDELCGLARTALDTDQDDRTLMPRTRELMDLPGAVGYAARVPGRVVWLAAMVAQAPRWQRGAAGMLVSDLTSIDQDLPLRAFQAAAQD